ncbi:VOC family protein [Flagellimonas iocasae]|uniref:VOC family protein n=1 Tax=Flagellimonas iocasae TaxID=2055905 RepID=A0ABW4XV42_9FLAO
MNQIITYLTFNGNCREAMEFYRECLGGELKIQTLENTPDELSFPSNLKKYVVQAVLKKENMLLMGTDMANEKLISGNAISILVDSEDEGQVQNYYEKLKEGGTSIYPLDNTFLGHLFGGLIDKYGHQWLFHCKR